MSKRAGRHCADDYGEHVSVCMSGCEIIHDSKYSVQY